MTNLIDGYLLKSGMPAEELSLIGRSKRSFYYYGMIILGSAGLTMISAGIVNMVG